MGVGMNKVFILAVVVLLVGCATQEPLSSGELQAHAELAAARETRVAQSTRDALAVSAKGTSDALALQEQATRQAVNLAETQRAATLEATRQAWAYRATVEAVETTSTASAIRATQNAEAAQATATAEASIRESTAIAKAGQSTAIAATSQAIERQSRWEQNTQTVTKLGGTVLVILSLVALVYIAWYLLPIVKARLQVVRRKQGEIEPVIVSLEHIIMPSRLFSPLLDVSNQNAPQLAPPEYQDRASGRAQLVDVVSAAQRPGRRVARRQLASGDDSQWGVEQASPVWPSRVPLSGILDGPPSVRNLALGVTVREDGRSEIVKADMGQLVHVAVGGSSGWGKSVFLRALAFQLAQSVEPVDIALVDLEGATFAPFAECSRLLYPVADTEREALAIFQALMGEMDRRKALYSEYPGVDSLATYNARASEPLAPVVALVDEATALVTDKPVENAIRTLVLRARKYGLWCVLGGQDWKASSLDTAIRNQLASRVQFRAMSASQSRVLLQRNGAERLDVPGRALAILPGRDIIELQAPVIGYRDIITATRNGGPRREMPEAGETSENDQAARIRELAAGGLSKRQIALEVFGYAGGAAYTAVSEALQGCTTTATPVQAGSIE
jgi:hypothetical protein